MATLVIQVLKQIHQFRCLSCGVCCNVLLKVTFDLVVTEPYGTELQVPGTALCQPFRRASASLQVDELSPSTGSSLNN